jgi:Fe-S cluster assembly protein SufB
MATADIDLGAYKLGWNDGDEFVYRPRKGISPEVVADISRHKGEPDWMTKFRLNSFKRFERKPMLDWFAQNMPNLDFDDIYYYIKPTDQQVSDWDMLPDNVKSTYEKLGIPEAERKFLAGVTAQYECLRGSTRVWTTRGMRRIKEIEPGDTVFSLDDERNIVPAEVLGAAQSGEKLVLEITARGRTIGASGNHPFLTLRDERKPGRQRRRFRASWVPAEELHVGDYVAIATGTSAALFEGFRRYSAENLQTDGSSVAVLDPVSELVAELELDPDVRWSDSVGFVRIDSIETVGVEPVYDIEVAGHHNFVAEGFVVHNSEVVYHRNRDDLADMGVLFCDMDTAVREYPDIVQKHLGTVIPPGDNKFAALNSAVWSGGSFIYVPPGVKLEMPLQAYFRINSENAGQFERTLIIADEGASVHYVEGCSAPVYSTDSLHSAVVELIAKPGSHIRYTTIQNWSPNVYNLVTKRARAEAESRVEWIDGNLGSKLTMKYPAVVLAGPKAHGEVLSVAYAGPGQHQDAGAKMTHAAPETTSIIESKSISKDGGRTTYRGLVRVEPGATNTKAHVRCDALILDDESRSDTYPYMEIEEQDARVGHEATVSKVGDDQLFYLMSRGLTEQQATAMIVNGFIEPIIKTLPMEYAVEMSRLVELNMEGAVG